MSRKLLMDEPLSALDALTRGSLQGDLLQIDAKTRQTSFMITHGIDEALLLADRIVLMTRGPEVRVCELVRNTLPAERSRTDMRLHPNYYPMRNHLIGFLVARSEYLHASVQADSYDPRNPPLLSPQANSPSQALAS